MNWQRKPSPATPSWFVSPVSLLVNSQQGSTNNYFYILHWEFCILYFTLPFVSRLPPLLGRCRKAEGTIQTPPPSLGLGDPSLSKEGSFCGYGCASEWQHRRDSCLLSLVSCLLSPVSCFLSPVSFEILRLRLWMTIASWFVILVSCLVTPYTSQSLKTRPLPGGSRSIQ